jgi:hypothetical protein
MTHYLEAPLNQLAIGEGPFRSTKVFFKADQWKATGTTIVKPAPVIAAEFTVTGDVPVDVSVNVCVVVVFTVTLPKLRLVALTVNCGFGAAVLVHVFRAGSAP